MLHWAPRKVMGDSHVTEPARAPVLRLEVEHSLDAVRPTWEELQTRAVATPFQNWSWVAQLARSGASEAARTPVIVLGYEGNVLKLLLPLAVEKRFGVSSLIWLNQDVSDYNCPLIDPGLLQRFTPEDAGAILRRAAALAGGADCLKLEKQPERLDGLPNPFASYSAKGFTCDAHATRLTGDWETFHDGKRSRKSQRRLREKASSLAKLGELSFREVVDPEERKKIIQRLLLWKSAQLEARGSRNPFRDGRLGALLADAAASPALGKLVRVHALKVGGELAAGALGFSDSGHYIYYVAAYDAERFARYSPGAILLTRLIEEMHRDGIQLFDFSNGDERYKDEWCDQSMGLTVTLLPLTLAGRVGIAVEAGSLRLIREIKSRPRLFSALRGFVSRVRSVRR